MDRSEKAQGDLWAWQGEAGAFSNLTPIPLPDAWPPVQAGAHLTFDPDRNQITMRATGAMGQVDLHGR